MDAWNSFGAGGGFSGMQFLQPPPFGPKYRRFIERLINVQFHNSLPR